ncbi:unnamed protein product [Coccothraustes coccothraustes]
MLVNLEPRDKICSWLRRLAMMAFAELSTIGAVLETKKILRLCFNSLFFLPPRWEMPSAQATLCARALQSMDIMLVVMVLNSAGSEMLQDILEILLDYLFSDMEAVQERAMGRIKLLCGLLTDCVTDQVRTGHPPSQIQMPLLGKLLAHLFFKLFRPPESVSLVVQILGSLLTFFSGQKCEMPESRAQPPECWESEITSWVNAPRAWKVQAFGRYLRPAERTDIVLEAIETLAGSSLLGKHGPMEFLEEAMDSPEMWLADVPKIVRHIFRYCKEQNTAGTDSLHSLLVLMVNKWPGRVVTTALEATPIFSDKVSLWKAMFSGRQTLEKVLKELQDQVQIWHEVLTGEQKSCLAFLSVLAFGDMPQDKIGPLYKNLGLRMSPKMEMVPLVLRALETLSESAETAKKMKGLLPEMLQFLGHWSWDVSVMALDTFHNILGHLKKKEASSVALKAVQRLWNLFDAKEDCVRERSISLFGALLGKTTWRNKEAMRRNSWKALVRLVLHMSDQAPGVAKASKEAVVAVAEFLKWKELKELVQKEQIWKMGECLLAKDSSRAEQFVLDSQPYLLSPQASLREAALRFYGLAARHLTEQNKETKTAVLSELGAMETQEENPSICSLAAQTSLILSSLRDQRKSGFSLRTLCCCCH